MRAPALLVILTLSACASRNDPELVNRISVTGAMTDARTAIIAFDQGLRTADVFAAIRLCTIRVHLELSANATRDNHAGLSATAAVAPGVTVRGDANANSSAADKRGNTVELVYASDNVVTCPPQARQEAATAAAPAATAPATAAAPTRNAAPRPVARATDPLVNTCFDLAFREKHPANPGESRTDWLRRICAPGTQMLLNMQ